MPRSRIIVEFADRPAYAVRIGGGLAAQVGDDLLALGVSAGRCLAVADSDSAARCLPAVRDSLAGAGFTPTDITVPAIDPADAWECVAELHRALSESGLAADAPVVVCAGTQVAEIAAFAVATYGERHPLIVVPASVASALRLLAVDGFELDAGFSAPLRVPAAVSFASVDVSLLACESAEEADFGLYELAQASLHCDDEYRQWQADNARAIASYEEDACVLALTQVLAARADAIGREISTRLS